MSVLWAPTNGGRFDIDNERYGMFLERRIIILHSRGDVFVFPSAFLLFVEAQSRKLYLELKKIFTKL